MPFRDKVRRVFHRSSISAAAPPPKTNRNGVKLEYYRRNEVPNSKFRGPFDPEHQKRLANWSFQSAMAERPRSSDLSLSPCTSLPDYLRPHQGQEQQTPEDDDEDMAPDQVRGDSAPVETDPMDSKLLSFFFFFFSLLSLCVKNVSDPISFSYRPPGWRYRKSPGRRWLPVLHHGRSRQL